MPRRRFSRRDVLKASTAVAASTVFASPLRAAAPPATAITSALIEAARKEGKVVWYTSVDLPLAERIAKAFEAKFAEGSPCRVERSGAERIFQRIGQEYGSNIHAVDVVNSSDAAHLIVWKAKGWLAPFVPEDVAKHYPAEHKDADGTFASFRIFLCPMGYNTNLVKPEEAPKSYADILDPKWAGKIVKAHPSYSGTILTATYQIARDIGWEFFEKLAKQRIMQVQSAADPPKKLAIGERAVMADGNEYSMLDLRRRGAGRARPSDRRHAARGRPERHLHGGAESQRRELFSCVVLHRGMSAADVDHGDLRSVHPLTKEKDRARAIQLHKTMKEDAEAVERESEAIKKRYGQIFKI